MLQGLDHPGGLQALIMIIIIIIIIIIIHHRRPDIVILKKKAKETIIVDIAVPGDGNILQKETEKCEKYQDLAREIQRIWKSRTKVLTVVVGALGSASKKLAGHLEQLGIKTEQERCKSRHSSDRHISSERCWKSEVSG